MFNVVTCDTPPLRLKIMKQLFRIQAKKCMEKNIVLIGVRKMKKSKLLSITLIIAFFLTGCEDKDNNQLVSGPEIEWISGGLTTSYTYSGGVLSGYYFNRSFHAINESGDVTIEVQVLNENETRVSGTLSVEKGMQYSIKVKGSISGSVGSSPVGKCLTVVFSSPNCLTREEISVNSYPVSSGFGDSYYCPRSLSFGEISIVE
jgi:hypothetical protein